MNCTYRYGLLNPVDGEPRVADQISLAHRYRNQLTELERTRRERIQAIMLEHSAAVEAATAEVQEVTERIESLVKAMARRRSERRTKADWAEDRASMRELKAERAAARGRLKAAKVASREDPVVVAALAAATADHRAAGRAARAASGLYWGTYGIVETAADAARKSVTPPRFVPWSGDGAVAVQLQRGLSAEAAVDGDDRRIQIDTTPRPVPGRSGKPMPRVRVRVGSDGRDPIWAEWPIVLHRPLPEGARIKWATVKRLRDPSRTARNRSRDSWVLLLSVEVPDPTPLPGARAVALDLRWSRTPEGLRAGGWCARVEDGTTDVLLDSNVESRLDKAASLRSIRDRHRDEVLPRIVAGLRGLGIADEEWLRRSDSLRQWRSHGRLGRLIEWWGDHRLDGDDEVYAIAWEWWKRDRHLWEYEAGTRRRALRKRREQYRLLAARLAEDYDLLVTERLDLAAPALAQLPTPDQDDPGDHAHPKARSQKVECAPSELRAAVRWAFRKRGKTVVTVRAGGPADELLRRYREQEDILAEPGVARSGMSKKQKRLRGLPVDTPAEATT